MGLVTIGEAASLLKISREFLYRLTRSGQLPHYRCGKEIRLDAEEIREFFKVPSQRKAS